VPNDSQYSTDIRLAEIMVGVRECHYYKVAHDADDFMGTKEHIGAYTHLGGGPLINIEWFIVRDT